MYFLQPLLLQLYTFITTDLPSNFFDNQFVSASLDFFQWFGIVIFAVSFILMLLNVIESRAAGEYVNFSTVFSGIYKSFILLVFSRPLVIWAFDFSHTIATSLLSGIANNVTLPQLPTGLGAILDGIKEAGNLSLISIIMLIMTIVVFFQILTLYGMLYIQIVTGYLYIADVMRGDQSAIIEWTRDVASTGITFMLEYIFYSAGFYIMDMNALNSISACAPGLILIIGSAAIPTALRKWGYSHGSGSARGVISAFTGAASGVLSAITKN